VSVFFLIHIKKEYAMSGPFKENWKRLSNRFKPNTLPTAMDPKDILRFEDAAALGTGSGVYTVTEVGGPGTVGYAPGGDEARFDLVVIAASGSYDVVLPEAPLVGKRYEIKDGVGDGCLPGVVKQIIPSGVDTIEGIFSSFLLSNCYQSWSLIYQGSGLWRLV
jgi:hypothetical protein